MLFNTTNKRVAKMMGDTGKVKNSRRYLKEVNKSVRNLYKDLKEEASGGKFNSSKATIDSMRAEAKMQKRGFYQTAFSKAWNDNRLVQLSKEYSRSLSKAMKTGKLYTRESDMFEAAMNRQNKILNGNSDPIQDINLGRTNATYDAAKAQISSMNANAKSQFEMGKLQTTETKMGFNRMSSAFAVGTQQTLGAMNSIHDYMKNVLKIQMDQSLQLDRERNAYLMEIRDLQKKMIINNDTYQKMTLEKDKGVVDLVLEGRFKDAFTKSGENLLNEFDKKQFVKIMSNSLPMMLQMAISNPMGFVKDIITGSDKFQKFKAGVDPKTFMEGQLNKWAGSKNSYVSRAARAVGGGGRTKLSDMKITNEYNKGVMQWSGIERKALVEVIPTYLRKILAAMTKTEELVYVYDDGNGNAGFTTKKDLRSKIDNFKNRDISGAANTGSVLEQFYRKANNSDSPPFSFLLNIFAKELAYSAIPNAIAPVFLWSFSKWKEVVPDTDFTEKTWKEMGTAATVLLNSSDKKMSDEFKKQLTNLQRSIDVYRKEHYEFIDKLNQNADLSGMSSLINNSDLYEPTNLFNNSGRKKKKKGGGTPPPKQDFEEEKRKMFARSRYEVKDDQVDAIINKRFGNDAGKASDYWDRLNSMSAKDFENAGIKLNAFHFKNWLKEKHKNLTDEQRDTLSNLFKNEKWSEVYKKVSDFGDYLDEIKYDHINDLNKATSSEVKKFKELKKLKDRQNDFNSAYTGLENSFDSISKDPVKQEAATGLIKKMFTAGGVAAVAGHAGLIPLAGTLGLPGVLMAAMGGIGISMLSNRKELSSLILGGMDEDQKANLKKVTSKVVSKVMTGAGFGAVAGLGSLVLGAGPLAPIFAATAGVAAAINSDKSGFKRFFFGEEHDENKTFFQLFKTKMLGDKETNDDGLFGRFLNPVFEKTAGLFDKFNENMEKNIFSPFKKWGKSLVEKIDASTLGQKFKDAMGFSLTEFNDVMKKNVWGPLTKNIFGGVKKLFGFGRKHVDEFQANQRAEYEMANSVTSRVEAELNPSSPPPTGGPNGGPDPAAASGSNKSRRASKVFGGYGGNAGKTFKHRNGQDAEDILTAKRVSFKDLASLVGSSDSIPAKHYYSQYDPQFKDIKLGILGKSSTIEKSGCAVMVGAMLLSKFGKVSNEDKKSVVTPKYIETALVPIANKNYSVTGSGVKYEFFRELSNKYSMEYSARKNREMFSIAEMKKITQGGKGAIVVLVEQETLGNHFILVTAVNGDRIYYDDPARKRNLVMSYEELCEGATLAMGIAKTKGLFGVLGKLFSGVVNFLNGNSQKNKMARRWGIRREYIDRMTRDEWNKYKTKGSLDQAMKDILVSRTPLMTNLDGSNMKLKNKLVEDRGLAETMIMNSINDKMSGKGAKKGKSRREKPKNAVDEIPSKNQYGAVKSNTIPSHLNSGMYFTNENAYRSLMLSATIHNTHVTNSMLGAIYTKLSEMEVTVFNGTNGVAYNVEHLKRMNAIKQFGSIKKANDAVGPIDETKLANSRFFGNRSLGIKAKVAKGLNWIKSKTIDPVYMQYLIMKNVLGDFAKKYLKFINPFWYLEKMGELSTKFIDATWELGNNIVKGIGAGFKAAGKILGGALHGIGKTIGGALKSIGESIGGFFQGIGSTLGGIATGFFDTIRSLPLMLSDTLEGITKTVTAAATGMVKLTTTFIGGVYGGAKNVVKDVWSAGKAVVKGVGNGIVSTAAFLSGGVGAVKKAISDRTTTFVRVIGGHLDTVGTVGSIDRDSFLAALKGVRRASGDNIIGKEQAKNNKTNQTIDEEQDKVSSVQDKQTELLEEIANKEGGSGKPGKEKEKDNSWLSQIAKWVVPALALGPYLVKKLKEFFLDTTKDGHSTVNIPKKGDPASYWNYATQTGNFDFFRHGKGLFNTAIKTPFNIAKAGVNWVKSGSFIDDAVRLPGKMKAGIVNRFKKLPGIREVNRMTSLSKRIGANRKTQKFLRKNWGMSSAQIENAKKGALAHAEEGVVTMKNGVYEKTHFVDEIVNGKMTKTPKIEIFTDELMAMNAKQAAKEAAKQTAQDTLASSVKAKWLNAGDKVAKVADDLVKSMATRAKGVLAKVFGNTALFKFFEANKKGLGTLIKEGMDKLVDKIITNPKVKQEIAKKGGPMLARAVPFINIAFLINDIYTGWRDADRYFNLPESKVTTRMKIISSLCRFTQGLISLLPFMWWFSILPTEWFTRMFWSMFGGKQKEQQKKDEQEAKDKYDKYYRETTLKGQKAKTYDDWIGAQGSKEKNIIAATASMILPKTDPKDKTKYSMGAFAAELKKNNQKAGTTYLNGGTGVGPGGFTNKYALGAAYGAGKGYDDFDTDGNPLAPGASNPMLQPGGGVNLGSPGKYAYPVDNRTITSRALKWRFNPATGFSRPHKGLDLRAAIGDKVYAIADGTVAFAGWENPSNHAKGYGLYVALKHTDGTYSKYAHLSKVMVSTGGKVTKGQIIGYAGQSGGSAGPHLHFELRNGLSMMSGVMNPEKYYTGFKYKSPELGKESASNVYGPGKGDMGNSTPSRKPPKISGMQTNMFGQNYSLNMSVGGDKMNLAEVGCGPVTANLFLQESGVRESLEVTARNLKSKREAGEGFSSDTLSKYINSRKASSKVLDTFNKNKMMLARFGIIFARRNSMINDLDENHAVFMKNTSQLGAVIFDPFTEQSRFYTWEAISQSSFEYIVPSKEDITQKAKGGKRDMSLLTAYGVGRPNIPNGYADIQAISKRVAGAMKAKVVNVTKKEPKVIKVTEQEKAPSVDNIKLENKLDTIIALLSQLVQNTAANLTGKAVENDKITSGINKAMNALTRTISTPAQEEKQDAWINSRNKFSRGGI